MEVALSMTKTTWPEKMAIACSAFSVLLGMVAAACLSDGDHLARSGSVLVVIALLLAASQLKTKVESAVGFVEQQLEGMGSGGGSVHIDNDASSEESRELWEKTKKEVLRDVSEKVDAIIKRILRVELWLALIGTLIWGFGDLLFWFVWPVLGG